MNAARRMMLRKKQQAAISYKDRIGSFYSTVGLKSDGTLVGVGLNGNGELNFGGASGFSKIYCAQGTIGGVRPDGTCRVFTNLSATNIAIANAATGVHSLALNGGQIALVKLDGTVQLIGGTDYNMGGIVGWTNIDRIEQAPNNSAFNVGLKKDGTAVSNGLSVSHWTDIVQIATRGQWQGDGAIGLKANGSLMVAGNPSGWATASTWTDLIDICIGKTFIAAVKANGTVVMAGSNSYGAMSAAQWTDIVAIAGRGESVIGLKKDGTVVALGWNAFGQCNTSTWDLF